MGVGCGDVSLEGTIVTLELKGKDILNAFTLKTARTLLSFGRSECNKVEERQSMHRNIYHPLLSGLLLLIERIISCKSNPNFK